MLRLDAEQYGEAVARANTAVAMRALDAGGTLDVHTIVCTVIDSVAEDFDVSPMDMGERNQMDDVVSGNVWPEDGDRETLMQRAIDAALAVAPRPGKVTSRSKIL